MKRSGFWAMLAVVMIAASSWASVVTSIPGGAVATMPAIDYSGGGPVTFGPGNLITWSSTNVGNGSDSLFGYTGFYGFGLNGNWTGALGPMAGLNDSNDFFGITDTMTFAFATPVTSAGGFLNYYLDYGGDGTPTTIAVWDSSGKLIESYTLTFQTNGSNDTGAFYGFQETTRDISYFTLTDNYIGVTSLTYAGVPEPASLLLLGTGLLGAVGFARRRLGL